MGKYLGSTLCIHHRDSNASMAIYAEGTNSFDGFRYSYYCFGCQASGYLDEDEAQDLLSTSRSTKKYTPRTDKYTLKDTVSPQAKEFLASRNIESKWYIDYGIRETLEGYLYLPCYDYSRREIGYQLRQLRKEDIINPEGFCFPTSSPKIWSCPGDGGKYPSYSQVYGYSLRERTIDMAIVESVLDGLSLWSRCGIPSIALLGTNPSGDFFRSLPICAVGIRELKIIFDPDTAGDESSARLVDKLRVLGYNVSRVVLEDKVYRVSKKILEDALL